MTVVHDLTECFKKGNAEEAGIFREMLDGLFVVDLSDREKEAIQPIETRWNRSIRAELRHRDLIHADHRGTSEIVNLTRRLSSAEVLKLIQPFADTLAGAGE